MNYIVDIEKDGDLLHKGVEVEAEIINNDLVLYWQRGRRNLDVTRYVKQYVKDSIFDRETEDNWFSSWYNTARYK